MSIIARGKGIITGRVVSSKKDRAALKKECRPVRGRRMNELTVG
jgi:hypothetical protein